MMEGAANAGSTGSAAGNQASKRRRSNVGKACLNCRRRKAKCDGLPPRCKTCETYNDECRWADDLDGRKPASRQYVHSLKARVKTLEGLLLAQGQAIPGDEGEDEDGPKSDIEEGLDSATQTMLHIHIADGAQDLQVHGPTSAFAHTVPARAGGPSQSPPVSRAAYPPADGPLEDENELLDYRRFLPSSVDLSAEQHALVLDRFFMFFSSWGMRAHPIAFYRDMETILSSPRLGPPSRSAQYSPFLHNIVLSIALKFADEPYLRDANTRELFALRALSFLNEELERPTLATVLALAIKSSYHSTMDEHTAGWTWFGLADRAAQTMGLNIDCEPLVEAGKMTAEEMKRRLHAFWSVFIQNQTWAVYIGRANPELQYTTRIPGVNPAIDAVPFRFETLPEGFPREPQQPSMLSTAFVETAKLSEIMQRIMQALYSIKSNAARPHRDNSVSELGLALDTWTEQLPAALVLTGHNLKNALPHILMLQMAREWANILIYRPYYRSIIGATRGGEKKESISITAVKRCDRSAARIVSLLRIWHERFGLAFSPPTILSIAFTAGTTHLLAAVHHRSPKLKEEAIGTARECIHLLRLVAVSWPAAGHKADILASLVSEYDPPSSPQPIAPAQQTSEASAYLGLDSLPNPQQYSLESVPDQNTMSDTTFWANPPDWLNMTSLSAPAPSQEPSDWFALMVQPTGFTDGMYAGMPEMSSDLGGQTSQQVTSPGEEAFLRSLFSMSGESPVANAEAKGPAVAPGTMPTTGGHSALSVSPQDRFGPSASTARSSHHSHDQRSSSFAPAPTAQPVPPPAAVMPGPAPFPYDMGSFIAGLRAAWEAEQATRRMTAQRGSPAIGLAPPLATPDLGTPAWASHGPTATNPGQPYQQ